MESFEINTSSISKKNNQDDTIEHLKESILNFLKNNPEGVTQERLTSEIPFKEEEIVSILNNLIEYNRVSIIDSPNKDGTLLFKYRSEKDALKFRNLSKEELSVLEIITQSGSGGVTTNDIKMRMRIESTTFINRILKTLEKKFLIKSLKVLNTKNKKIWIGYDIVPSQEITGGIWCNNQEFDENLVNIFSDKCYEYICNNKSVTRNEILLYSRSSNLIQGDIKDNDIQKILNILIFDGKIEPIFPEGITSNYSNKFTILLAKDNNENLNKIKYQKCRDYKPKVIFNCVPCSLCPSFNECKSSNVVNPINCPHLRNFLEDSY